MLPQSRMCDQQAHILKPLSLLRFHVCQNWTSHSTVLTSLRFEDLNLDQRVNLSCAARKHCVRDNGSMVERLVVEAAVPRRLSHSHEDRENALSADLYYFVP